MTSTDPAPPAAVNVAEIEDNVRLPVIPDWVIAMASEPTAIRPDRLDVPGFAAIEKLTRPFPVPFAPELIVIHEVEGVAVQEQPAGATTSMMPVPPEPLKFCNPGFNEAGQAGGAA